ncbi:MAG: hypothetical protein LBJ67_15000 [Planctomycetaceae bacterium]|nr:hypothetical protein [Planctomycetaceae bacterium]
MKKTLCESHIEEAEKAESIKTAWNAGLIILFCALSFFCPIVGWILGGLNLNKEKNSKGRRKQAAALIIIGVASFVAGLVFFCINGYDGCIDFFEILPELSLFAFVGISGAIITLIIFLFLIGIVLAIGNFAIAVIFDDISRHPVLSSKTESMMEPSLPMPIVISKYRRIIFEKSIWTTMGSLCIVLIGMLLLCIVLVVVFEMELYKKSLAKPPIVIPAILVVSYPFWAGLQTLIRRRKVELTPDGLSYLNYFWDTYCGSGLFSIANELPGLLTKSDKRFFSWQDINALERVGKTLRIYRKKTAQEPENMQDTGKENTEDTETTEEISLAGFDAKAEKIGTMAEEYYNRYKNGYLFEQEPESEAFSYRNNSIAMVLTLSVLYWIWSLISCDWFFVQKIVVKFCCQNVSQEIFDLIVWLLICMIWFLLVRSMWKAIPVSVATFRPSVAAFISLIPFWGCFIVFRKWAEDLNKAANWNGQGDICLVPVVTLFWLLWYLILLPTSLIWPIDEDNWRHVFLIIDIIDLITTAVFLAYVCACIRLLKTRTHSHEVL